MLNIDKTEAAVLLDLGGEKRKLEYSLRSCTQIQKLIGKNVLKGEVDLADPQHLIVLVWAGLITNYPDMDGLIDGDQLEDKVRAGLDQVSRWITADRLMEVVSTVARAFSRAMPPEPKNGAKKTQPADQTMAGPGIS